MEKNKRIVIVGATSGIGYEVAHLYIKAGWQVGLAGRRTELLAPLQALAPDRVMIETIDVTSDESPKQLLVLIEKLGGMDLFLLSSGTGSQNSALDLAIELQTVETNALGFVRMTTAAFHYFRDNKRSEERRVGKEC